MQFNICEFFRKYVEKIQVSLKSNKNLAEFFLEWEMSQTKVVQKIKTHILCSIIFFSKIRRLWDIVDNMVEPDWPQVTI
jgi:hypothetical protein